MEKKNLVNEFSKGLFQNNPAFVQALGMCPTLATTTSAKNGLGMGLATLSVLVLSNIVISAIRKLVPEKIRIPVYIIIIAGFVTMIDMVMHGFTYELWKTLGIFIPLIVVNCIILGRAEAFASKNGIFPSILDGLGMGIGFTLALTLLGSIRELFGAGTVFGITVWGDAFNVFIMILPAGAFLTMGLLSGLFNWIGISRAEREKQRAKLAKQQAKAGESA
ncbi:MAG TPA: electron transport complex subunit E [Thermotogota bacterium]|nr:electron transport complex subunit E [Thermotogota bacterium]HRW93547.1 electron transport complex subunit E [Thermotogota bacterium]